MYQRVLVALDGSTCSNFAQNTALEIAQKLDNPLLIGCHAYTAQLHRTRFGQMEPGLPPSYQEVERLNYLRNTHEDIITTGMQLISDAYLSGLASKATELGVNFASATPEGHNYVQLLNVIKEHKPDLVVLGATGHGGVPESSLGSVAERILLYAKDCDVLLVRRRWDLKNHPIIVGVDGSDASYVALARAIGIAKFFSTTVEAIAIYDPYFHTGVFQTISDALPEADKARFNFAAQEQLHDEIIDGGLESLYKRQLERGAALALSMDFQIETSVIAGKVFPQLHHYAALKEAGLLVVGRYGIHAEEESLIGSNSHNVARLTATNFLAVGGHDVSLDIPVMEEEQQTIPWTPEAEVILNRIPPFAQTIARRAIEARAKEERLTEITPEFVQGTAQQSGMGKSAKKSEE